jgi:hypothetical protein
MSALSIFPEGGGPALGCANPIYVTSEVRFLPGERITFEVLERDASQLKSLVGKTEMFGLESKAFFGRLVSLGQCDSSVPALAMMRDTPTLCGVFEIYPTPSSKTDT